MQENGPLYALVLFIVLTLIFGFMAFQAHSELEGPTPEADPSTRKEKQIEAVQAEIRAQEEKTQTLQNTLEQRRKELRFQRAKYEHHEWLVSGYELAYKGRQIQVDGARQFKGRATELSGKVTEVKNKTMTEVRKDENEIREKMEKEVKELTTSKEEAIARTVSEKKGFEKDDKTFKVQRNFEQSGLDEYKRQLESLTVREVERANISLEIDGHVILADTVHNTIVIDRGTANGVQNGFRFEVFALRSGNKKYSKGHIEVRKATANVSECQVVQQLVELPRDPLSQYVASQPEEMYSPYNETGSKKGSGSTLQVLSGIPKKVVTGMPGMDPIVEGDNIQNPFYSPNKTFTFYVAGGKEVVQGVQKSAIAYPGPHIERTIQFYGAKVSKKVDLGVDFMIAQKNPGDDDNYNRGVALGIPVIYEWELFRFLDQR